MEKQENLGRVPGHNLKFLYLGWVPRRLRLVFSKDSRAHMVIVFLPLLRGSSDACSIPEARHNILPLGGGTRTGREARTPDEAGQILAQERYYQREGRPDKGNSLGVT